MKNDKVDIYPFTVDSFLADKLGRVRVTTLLNFMCSCISRHAEARNFGATASLGWVLARMALHIERMPMQREQLYIHTWVRGVYRGFIERCVKAVDADGNEVATLFTIFALLDLNTRCSVDLNGDIGRRIAACVCPDEPLAVKRVPPLSREAVEGVAFRRTPQYSDVDINGHMNSIRYLDHILDSLPTEYIYTHNLTDFVVAYMQEGSADEELSYGIKQQADNRYLAQVTKADGTVASRCELKFEKTE